MSERFDPAAALTGPGAPFEVTTEEVAGVETRVYKQRMKSMREVLENSGAFGGKDFIVQGERRLTFSEHLDQAHRVATRLAADFEVKKADRVAILSANSPEWVVAFWAIQTLGAIAVPLNAWWKAEELTYALEDSGTRILICDQRRLEAVREVLHHLDFLRAIFVMGRYEGDGEIGGIEIHPFEDLLNAQASRAPDWPVYEDDPAAIFYTSGTTGKPKGSISTQRNIIANLQNVMFFGLLNRMVKPASQSSAGALMQVEMASLLVVPLFHVTGCYATMIIYLATGGKIVLMPPGPFDPVVAMTLIQDEKITSFGGVPTVVQRVIDHPDFDKFDLSTLNQVVYGGAPPPLELARKVRERFPNVSNAGGAGMAYGLTETAAIATLNVGDSYFEKPDSAGKPLPVIEIKIVREDGTEASPGERGEIWIKGPTVSPGYWNKPEATAESFTDGWLHTGDIGILDDEGWLYVVDRAKDMIIRGGENVYSIEVEDVIYTHPDVAECAVVGVPHPDLGEEVKAVIVPRDRAKIDPDEIRGLCAKHLADFKVPSVIELRENPLPRNPAGKVLKPALRGDGTAFEEDAESDSTL